MLRVQDARQRRPLEVSHSRGHLPGPGRLSGRQVHRLRGGQQTRVQGDGLGHGRRGPVRAGEAPSFVQGRLRVGSSSNVQRARPQLEPKVARRPSA